MGFKELVTAVAAEHPQVTNAQVARVLRMDRRQIGDHEITDSLAHQFAGERRDVGDAALRRVGFVLPDDAELLSPAIVALDPRFSENRLVYWSYAEPGPEGNGTAVARGKLAGQRLRLGAFLLQLVA